MVEVPKGDVDVSGLVSGSYFVRFVDRNGGITVKAITKL